MVDRSNLIVFYIQHESGGAWQTMKYAKKQGISCVNLNDPLEDIIRMAESVAAENANVKNN